MIFTCPWIQFKVILSPDHELSSCVRLQRELTITTPMSQSQPADRLEQHAAVRAAREAQHHHTPSYPHSENAAGA